MKFSDRLKEAREKKGYTQQDVARLMNIDKSTYCGYETGKRQPDVTKLKAVSVILGVSVDDLLETGHSLPSNIIPMPEMKKIPLVGAIACGAPILAEEHIEEYISIPKEIHADFALTCKGDSMVGARIYDGDIVYIRQQETVENGEIAAVLIDDEATLKRVHVYEDHIVLSPENPMYKPLAYWDQEMAEVHILGKAVAFTSAVR